MENLLAPPCCIYLIPTGIILYLMVYQLFIKPFYFSPFRNMPGPPLGHPVYGQFMKMITDEPGSLQVKWADDYGPAVRFVGPFGLDHLLFLEPSALERILVKGRMSYSRPKVLRNLLGLTVGHGLLTANGSAHKQMRKKINPAFSLSNLTAQTDMLYPPVEGFIQILHKKFIESPNPEEGIQIPIYDWVSRIALDIICATALDYHPDSVHQPDNKLATAYRRLLNLPSEGGNLLRLTCFMCVPGVPALLRTKFAAKFHKFLFFGPLKPFQTLVSALDDINTVCRPMIQAKLSEAAVEGSDDRKDLLSLLSRARLNDESDDSNLSDQDLMEHAQTILGAGHETTASGISWTLWLLAKNPECQRRLRDEVLPIIQNDPRPDHRVLKQLSYLNAVIMESLRVLPPVPYTIREAEQDDWIDGYHIPKGSHIYIPIRAINTWERVWGSDAKEFRPERWYNLPSTYNPTFSFLSFIAGPQSCVGRTMAIMEMKVVIAMLISNFSFKPAYEGQTARASAVVSMKPQDDLPLKVKLVGKLPVSV